MTKNGQEDREIKIHVPEGMDKGIGELLYENLFTELHDLEPLALPQAKHIVAQGLLNDMPKLSAFRQKIAEAPEGARWGITIAESQSVFMPGGSGSGIFIEAAARLREAKASGDMNLVIGTLTCFALITSAPARGLLAMHGFGMKITAPRVPETTEGDA